MTKTLQHIGASLLAATWLLVTSAFSQVQVNEPQVCLQCHDTFKQTLSSKHVHTPLKTDGKCSQCHNPHAARHNALLQDETKNVCYGCHSEEAAKLDKPVVHDPVAKGECLSCHDAHASQYADQLRAPIREVCISCHEQAKGWLSSPVKHDPMINGSCTTCHDAHSSEHDDLTKKDVYTLCSSCHKIDTRFSTVHKGYDLRGANCTACHNPHGSKSKGLLMPMQHNPFAANNCQACHSNLQSAQGKGFALKGKMNDLCQSCHKEIAQSYTSLYRHVPPDKNECTTCHNPHAAGDAPLLKTDQKSLCFGCHGTVTGFTEDYKGSPHGDQNCTSCHVPHGSDQERFLADESIALCSNCHKHQHQITHPLGSGAVDPRTQKPMTCISCHQIHLAKANPLLPLEGNRELCVQCHKGK
jgi:predicted CXXCH cytochrome family protein